jgi:hypothetical protein
MEAASGKIPMCMSTAEVSELHNIEEARHILFTKKFMATRTAKAGFIKRTMYSYIILLNIYFMRTMYIKREIYDRIGLKDTGVYTKSLPQL